MANQTALAVMRVALMAYIAKIKQKILARVPPSTPDSEKLNGLTPDEIRAGVTKGMVGLDKIVNFPMTNRANNVLVANPAQGYCSPGGLDELINTGSRIVSRAQGETVANAPPEIGMALCFTELVPGSNSAKMQQWRARRFLERLNVVSDQAGYDITVAAKESFADVFNNWNRFSHKGYVFPANPAELEAWTYDEPTDSIKSTLNSETFIGFVSYEPFGDYDFEVELSSDDQDHDWIGIVLCYVELAGQQHVLAAHRVFNSNTITFTVDYNPWQGATNGTFTVSQNNGGIANPNPYKTENGGKGWSQVGVIRLRARRRGDTIEVWTTLPNAPAVWQEASKITINLASDPRLDKFRGTSRFGYCANSQRNATWRSLARPGERRPIYRVDTGTVYLYQNDVWVQQSAAAVAGYIQPNTFYLNSVTHELFLTNSATDFIKLTRR